MNKIGRRQCRANSLTSNASPAPAMPLSGIALPGGGAETGGKNIVMNKIVKKFNRYFAVIDGNKKIN